MKRKINKLVLFITGMFIGYAKLLHLIIKSISIDLEKYKKMSNKHFQLFMLMNNWVRLKQGGKSISNYFVSNGYRRIAIYGMNYVGRTLLDELNNTDVEIVAGIDKNIDSASKGLKIYHPDRFNEVVDVIIVTPITFYYEIYDEMEKKVTCPIISLKEIIFDMNHR